MRKHIQIFCVLFCIAVLSIIILYKLSGNKKGNGFNREFSPDKVQLDNEMIFENDNYAFVSITPDLISLYKFKEPYGLLEISMDLKEKHKHTIPFLAKTEKTDGMNTVAL
ncbi:hypothetical protein SAMN05660841_03282 [Sphingobacterium nematocida]|uniref:Uncharacterized protein n=1 Tax=Sphingobacterium nematocida TaxID=1513896 RepID=A0A1T5FIF1_9SPHI|nr:hypothetical protein [Sphingobacterium nematocida]SKB95872.1 hypothetical protein SAMN05660841_03282 [Sphingobacterium nematocida]